MAPEMKRYRYSSNNSGGSWWLTDENWKALEEAGWTVSWYKGQVESWSKKPYPDDRWLGALASEAFKEFISEECAIAEFNTVAQQNYYDQGCSCCGSPHWISHEPVRDDD